MYFSQHFQDISCNVTERGAESSGLVETNNINETSTKQIHTKSNRAYTVPHFRKN
jgi:hypothetical protein